MCQTDKETMAITPICGSLDSNFSKSSTGIILITQMLIAIVAFFAVQFSSWCLESVGSIRTFTSLSLFVFWLNMVFFIIFLCNLPYKIGNINWLLLTFLQQLFGAFFMLIAVIVLAINPCSIGQIIGVIIGIVLLIFYALGCLLVYRNYLKPERSLEPMDATNADLPDVTRVTDSVRDKVDQASAYLANQQGSPEGGKVPYPTSGPARTPYTTTTFYTGHYGDKVPPNRPPGPDPTPKNYYYDDGRPPTPPGPYLAPTTFYAPPHPPPPTMKIPPPPPQRTYLSQ